MSTFPLSIRTLTSKSTLIALMIMSCAASTAVLSADSKPSPLSEEDGWSDNVGGKDSTYTCPANQVMIGRAHYGDTESGEVYYKCSTYEPYGEKTVISAGTWSEGLTEGKPKGHSYTCPDGAAMIGSKHTGDENGTTTYQCGTVSTGSTLEKIVPGTTISNVKESSHQIVCPVHQILIGRQHHCSGGGSACDENQDTSYFCGYMKALPLSNDYNR